MSKALARRAVGAGLLITGLALACFLPRSGAAQGRGQGPEFIPGHYVVVLKASGLDSAAVGADLNRRHGLRVGRVYRTALNGFSAVIPDARLDDIAADPRVAYIERDYILRLDPTAKPGGAGGGPKRAKQVIPWGITRIGATTSSAASGNGSDAVDIDIAILDTGIDTDHPDLLVAGGVNYAGGFSGHEDGHGHGTHVAGTAAARDNTSGVVGVAPGARLWAVRVLDNSGSGTYSGVVQGVDWVAAQGAIEVANMSLGGAGNALNTAVENAVAAGKVFVVAAGNSGADAAGYTPASAPSALTISALTQTNTLASFSNWGTLIDFIAPGVSILSTARGGGTTTMSGTSMASPHVAGAAALYRSTHPTATPADVRAALAWAAESGAWSEKDGIAEPLVNVDGF